MQSPGQQGLLLGNSRQTMFLVCLSMVIIQTGRYMFKMENLSTFMLDTLADTPALRSGARGTSIRYRKETSQYNHYDTPVQRLQQTIRPVSDPPVAAKDMPVIKDPKTKTWALVSPPGLMGGYRNQVFRLFGFILAAQEQNIKQLLLPSILWSTRVNNTYATRPVPMEDLFDIDHWNSLAKKEKEFPKLADVKDMGDELDCWTSPTNSTNSDGFHEREQNFLQDNQAFTHTLRTQSSDGPLMERILSKPRFLTPIANISLAYTTGHSDINPRKFDVSPQVQHCKNPIAFGAGGGRGVLWVNYMNYNRRRPRDPKTGHVQPSSLEQNFLQALRPLPKWRQLAQQCVIDGMHSSVKQENNFQSRGIANVIDLHPRVELEMMGHSCGVFMNKNLTKIFDDITDLLQNNTQLGKNISGVFVALHRAGAASKEGRPYQRFRAFVDENIETMDRVIGNASMPGTGLLVGSNRESDTRRLPVFECGEQLMERYLESQLSTGQPAVDYGSLLPSIINFEVAVESAAFVGMRSSSWSNSVWTTRYYIGKGDTNFEYTRERGIQRIENGGLPPPHQNCDGMKDPG